MNTQIIEIEGLSKSYGAVRAVERISLQVGKGQVYGLLGPNGSGKSTTLGMILSLLRPDAGSIRLFGSGDLDSGRRRTGVSLETHGFYPYFSGEKNLRITSLAKGADPAEIGRVMEIVKLDKRKKEKFGNYSLGMKQRLSIASALLGSPELIVLDEPTNGLDPLGIIEIRELIRELSADGRTLLIASHLLSEMERICTHAAIMQKGTIKKAGPIHEFMSEHSTLETTFINLLN
jgi:ABC-type multidrug transport system ATPase subunit